MGDSTDQSRPHAFQAFGLIQSVIEHPSFAFQREALGDVSTNC